jgi:hypothetical protein
MIFFTVERKKMDPENKKAFERWIRELEDHNITVNREIEAETGWYKAVSIEQGICTARLAVIGQWDYIIPLPYSRLKITGPEPVQLAFYRGAFDGQRLGSILMSNVAKDRHGNIGCLLQASSGITAKLHQNTHWMDFTFGTGSCVFSVRLSHPAEGDHAAFYRSGYVLTVDTLTGKYLRS